MLFMKENFLQWLECMVMCTEARYMWSCHRGISRFNKQKISWRCFETQYDLQARSLSEEFEPNFGEVPANNVKCCALHWSQTCKCKAVCKV